MTITLPDNLERVVERHLASGRYPAPADVIAAALDLLDADTDAALRTLIAEGMADVAAGRVAPFSAAQILAEVRAEEAK